MQLAHCAVITVHLSKTDVNSEDSLNVKERRGGLQTSGATLSVTTAGCARLSSLFCWFVVS